MDAIVNRVIDAILGLPPWPLYLIVFGTGFASTAFGLDVVLPGETGVLLGGIVAGRSEPTFLGVFIAGAVGATLGDTFSYYLGRRYGRDLIRRWEPVRKRLEPQIDRAEDFYDRRGGVAVFAGRWVGTLRSVMAFTAGLAGMPTTGFLAWNVAASTLWSLAIVSIGYYLGNYVIQAFRQATSLIAFGAVGLVSLWFGLRWIERHPERAPDMLTRHAPSPRLAVAVGAAVLLASIVVLVVV